MKTITLLFFTFLFMKPTAMNLAKASASPQKAKILILGDSLTEGYGVTQRASWPMQLQQLLDDKKRPYKIIAAGSSGSTSAGAHARLKWHLKNKPRFLILALGGNDGLRGISVQATKANLKKAVLLAHEKGVTVYIAGMQMPPNYGEKYRESYQSLFPDLARETKSKLIPFLLKGVGGVEKYNLPDKIHPNEAGHKKIAQNVYDAMEKDLCCSK